MLIRLAEKDQYGQVKRNSYGDAEIEFLHCDHLKPAKR